MICRVELAKWEREWDKEDETKRDGELELREMCVGGILY